MTDLLASLTSVGLLAAVRPLVPLHVVLLDEAHVALIAAEWLLSCRTTKTPQLEVTARHKHPDEAARDQHVTPVATHHCGSSRAAEGGISG